MARRADTDPRLIQAPPAYKKSMPKSTINSKGIFLLLLLGSEFNILGHKGHVQIWHCVSDTRISFHLPSHKGQPRSSRHREGRDCNVLKTRIKEG